MKISLKSTADVSKLVNLTNIAVEIRATVQGTKSSTFAVLNVEILGECAIIISKKNKRIL